MGNEVVRDGYKVTDVGVIPIDWEVDRLERFWSVTDCKHLTAKFVNDGIPVASIQEVQSRFVELKNAKKTTSFYYSKLIEGGRKPQPGDLIFSRNATVGEVAQVAEWHPPFAMGQDVCLLSKKKAEFSSNYLQAVLQSNLVLQQLTDFMVGSTFKRVNVEQIRHLTVPMPPLDEQEKIGGVLSDVDSAIASLDKLISKKRNLKQGAMQSLLSGKQRLPGFSSSVGYKETEIGLIPQDWDTISIQNALDSRMILDQMDGNHGELYPRSHEFVSTGIPYIGANDFSTGKLSFKTCKYLTEERANTFKKGVALNGDVLFAHNATVGPVTLLEIEFDKVILSTTATYYRCDNSKLNNKYLRYAFEANYFVSQYSAVMSQSTRNQVPITTQRKFNFVLPSISEQKAIAQILSDMDVEIEILEKKRDKYKAIKQGMMQELLTGKTRLK